MARISREEAQRMVSEMQAQEVRSAEIRRRMMDEGFSFSEIYEMMGEEQYPDKPKRKYGDLGFENYGKTKNDHYYPQQFERGGCLSAYLVVQAIGVVLGVLAFCYLVGELSNSSYSRDSGGIFFILMIIVVAVSGLQLMCINWLWNGEKKGYQGLLILFALSAVLNLFSGAIPQVVGNIVGIAILVGLVQSKEHQLT